MSTVTVKTNHQPRDLLDWHELTDAERAEFDYIDAETDDTSARFFRYRGSTYDVHEFLRTDLEGWDGFQADSFFSGIAVRFPMECGAPDYERVIVGLVLA